VTGCNWSLSQIASATNGELRGGDPGLKVSGVTTDTRKLSEGQFFVALKGPNYNAHDFVPTAIEAGAVAVMVEYELDIDIPQVVVKDCLKALGQFASAWRLQWGGPLIAVTGSNGKTTVKEMLAAIFSQQGAVLATAGNLNNDIGVPLTLLSISETDQTAIIEMGANHPNEIEYLTGLAKPAVALITNAAASHLEGFGSVEGVAKAKGEIFSGLFPEGFAVINADDVHANIWYELTEKRHKITFGMDVESDVSCKLQRAILGTELQVVTPKGSLNFTLKLLGKHNVMNALAAIAAAVVADVSLKDISKGLSKVSPVPGRLQTKPGLNGSRIIDDTYNANPNSLNAALDVLIQFEGKRILALGDMGELGEDTQKLHNQAGEQARLKGVDRLYGIGPYCVGAVEAFGDNAMHFDSQVAMTKQLELDLTPVDTLLVKGSRAMQMDKVVNAVVLNPNQGGR